MIGPDAEEMIAATLRQLSEAQDLAADAWVAWMQGGTNRQLTKARLREVRVATLRMLLKEWGIAP